MKRDAIPISPDPKQKWKRINFNPDAGADLCAEDRADLETTRDLAKSIEQLACDVHDMSESVKEHDDIQEILRRLLHAQARMVVMMARVAIENRRMTRAMIAVSIAALTCAIVALWK